MMFWYDHNMGWWGWAGMGIGMVLFWAHTHDLGAQVKMGVHAGHVCVQFRSEIGSV
jgi:hypothetical protein